jgi:uncharacterized protein YydD (DUF2326 family)
MKLSHLYSNKPNVFNPVRFSPGLNVVIAEIRDPANLEKDTHNLGKSTLSRMIDFALLKERSKDFFLFKHENIFSSFIFFIEIDLENGSFLTLRRAVENASKISFKYQAANYQDFSSLAEEEWDHWEIPFERAKSLLDGALDLQAIKPFGYRQALGYALRTQDDYDDVFRLSKFAGKHSDWKPYLAKVLGFDAEAVSESYELSTDIENQSAEVSLLRIQIASTNLTPDKLEGILLVREKEVRLVEKQLELYNFQLSDSGVSEQLVNEIESRISELNERRYYLQMSRKRISDSLRDRVLFDPEKTRTLFEEAGVLFQGQIKRSFDELIAFNISIADERESYLKDELQQITQELSGIESELIQQNDRRASSLSVLQDRETFSKYRKMSEHLVELRTNYELLTRLKHAFDRIQTIEKQVTLKKARREEIKQALTENILAGSEIYRAIRLAFSDIVKHTIDREAVLSTRVNEQGNLEFSADILNERGAETSEALGHTYQMLLCIAFDMAVVASYLGQKFIHFIFHDGIFEGLDDRKKLNLIHQAREYCGRGIQHIVTLIDSDLPMQDDGKRFRFETDEVCLILHDQGDAGRLFKMPVW